MLELLAQDAQPSGGGLFTILIFALPLLMFFFLQRSNRRRQNQQRSMQQAVTEGEEILTTSGMFGTVVEVDDDEDTMLVEIAPGTRIRMVRQAVARRMVEEDVYDEDESTSPDDEGPIASS